MEFYDKSSPASIESYAKKLLDLSLRRYFGGKIEQKYQGKGKLGQLLEEKYFKYKINSRAEPDFPEAGVELKSTPVKYTKDHKLVSKERLVLNIINYMEEWKYSFKDSSFWKKNNHLLLMFYLWEEGKIDIDYVFKIIRLWNFPAVDLKIIKDDWFTIHNKILAGKADEISEGDTFYLAACMKGSTKEKSQRKQPFSKKLAMQRAYSLKNKYMNTIINLSLDHINLNIDEDEINWVLDEWQDGMAHEPLEVYKAKQNIQSMESIVKDVRDYDSPQETFTEYVEKKFVPYYGLDEKGIALQLDLDLEKLNNNKSKFAIIVKNILGIKKDNKIAEFEKAGIKVKTIRLTRNNTLNEAMSFKNIQYKEIVNESWKESYWYDVLTHKLFFVVFIEDNQGLYHLRNAFFWNMPEKDLEEARRFWEDTKGKIKNGDFSHFIKASDNRICHVRPKGRNSSDMIKDINGRYQKKYCYWLNRAYIKKIIDDRQLYDDKIKEGQKNTEDFVIVGFVSNAQYIWVEEKNIYNLRYGNIRGSANITEELVNAKYLLLHHEGKSLTKLFRLDSSGPAVWSKKKLIANGYPTTPHSNEYLVYHIIDKQDDFLSEPLSMKAFPEYNKSFESPFTISLNKLQRIVVHK